MATEASKIDTAAQKAYAEAAAKKVDSKKVAKAVDAGETKVVKTEKVAKAVAAPAKKAPVKKTAAKKAPVKKAAPKKVAAKKPATRKAAAKPAAKKPAVRKAPVKKKTPVKAAAKIAAKPNPAIELKDKIMATAKTTDFSKTAKEMAATAQTRIKGAYDKSSEVAGEVTEFTKGNVEAVVESGKILASGVQDMGREALDTSKGAVEVVTADVKKMASVKSPTELMQLQGEIARRNFDAAIGYGSKSTEAWVKLANEAFAPISSRMSVAAEKFSKAA